MTKLAIFTIALDAIRFLPAQLYTFNRLDCDWTWYIAEGTAISPYNDLFNKSIAPRLSADGTTEFLNSIKAHPRVHVLQNPLWPSKTYMCNALLDLIHEPCVLMQIDADELWGPRVIEAAVRLIDDGAYDCARFFCRYFVGPNLVTSGHDCFGNTPDAWWRAWSFEPGQKFVTHAPPVLKGCDQNKAIGQIRNPIRRHSVRPLRLCLPRAIGVQGKILRLQKRTETMETAPTIQGSIPCPVIQIFRLGKRRSNG